MNINLNNIKFEDYFPGNDCVYGESLIGQVKGITNDDWTTVIDLKNQKEKNNWLKIKDGRMKRVVYVGITQLKAAAN